MLLDKVKKIFYNYSSENFNERRTFFKIFFYSIISSFSILILSTFLIYLNYQKASINEIQKKSLDQLEQTTEVFTSVNSLIFSNLIQLNHDLLIIELLNKKVIDKQLLLKSLERLDNVLSSNLLLHSITVYNSQTNEYISTFDGYEGNNPCDLKLPEILKNINKYKVYTFIPRKMNININKRISYFKKGIVTENVITIVAGEIPESGNKTLSALIINISEEKLRKSFLAANKVMGGELIIIDGNGMTLSHPQIKYFGENLSNESYIKKILNEKKQNGIFVSKINNKKYLISFSSNTQMKWKFINITPYDKIFKEINSYRNFSIIIFIIFILAAIFLSLLLTRRIYQPIQNLFNFATSFKNKFNIISDNKKLNKINEIQYLDDFFHNIIKRVNDLDNYIETHKNNNYDILLRNIIYGNILPSEIEDEYFDNIKLFFNNNNITMAIINIDRIKIISNYNNLLINKYYKIISELINSKIKVNYLYFIMEKGQLIFLFKNIDNVNIYDFLLDIQNNISGMGEITISINLSREFSNETEITTIYQETLIISKFKFKFGNNSIIKYDQVFPLTNKDYVFPEQKTGQLFNELKLGKIEKVQEIMDEIFYEITNYNYEDFIFMVQLLSYQTIKIINNIEADLNYELTNCKKIIENLKDIDTINDVKELFLKTFSLIIKTINSSKQNQKNELINFIKNYINDNLYNPSLCPDKISSKTDFSTQHIRNIFKNHSGISLSDYINNLRIDHCKKILIDTNLTVKDISKNSGFLNYNYFFTSFKKHTGVTPEFYRQKNKKY